MTDKEMEAVKTKVAGEVKQLAKKIQPIATQAKTLRAEEAKLCGTSGPKKEDLPRITELRKELKDLEKPTLNEAKSTSDRLNAILKLNVPDDQRLIPEWQKGMDKWYRDLINKEPGFLLGKGLRLNGDISIKDRKASITLSGKF